MTNTKYNKSEIMTRAWETFKSVGDLMERYNTYAKCLKAAWKSARIEVEYQRELEKEKSGIPQGISTLESVIDGKVWNDRIYVNTNNGSIFIEVKSKNTASLGIKKSDRNIKNFRILDIEMSELAKKVEKAGFKLVA